MESTLYPKITNKLSEVRHALVKSGHVAELPGTADAPNSIYTPSTARIIGTVKLHGTHADILVNSKDQITLQSRNNLKITKENDNYAFAVMMEQHFPAILRLRNHYRTRFQELNPTADVKDGFDLLIAGEWIGSKIQRGVAISTLSRRFVIISAAINHVWLPDADYADIYDENALVYNISRSGFYHATLDFNNLAGTLQYLDTLTEKVERECPFGSTFDVQGPGEGIVWKLEDLPSYTNTWFKVKGEKWAPTSKVPEDPIVAALREQQKGVVGAFAERAVSENRLEQGWDYLREMGIERKQKEVGAFLKWLNGDINVEERAEIREKGIDNKRLRDAIKDIARPWYLSKVNSWEDQDCIKTLQKGLGSQHLTEDIDKIGMQDSDHHPQ